MDEAMSEQPLMMAARAVCLAIDAHAQACAGDPGNVAAIVGAGEVLVAAVLEYERRLAADTGWSNPVRHLGRLRAYTGDDERVALTRGSASDVVRVRVAANYLVEVDEEELLGNFVEAHGGDHPSSVAEAVRFLVESDGWDVRQYPPGRLRLVDTDVDIEITE